jgi:hypothetical protein
MTNNGNSDIADVLRKIRARLQTRIEADLHTGDRVSHSSDSPSRSIGPLQGLLASMQIAHRQVGVVNPRNPGPINDLIQILKKSLRRALTWYTRSIIEFQAAAIRFLAETVEILGRDQSRLATLEKKIEILTAELASLRQQVQSRPERIVRDPGRSEMEEK